ncbi:hypothetical protein [Clostridium sp. UBA6640]|uniref:hypothetical protein n=1 Tax=Clostridium sp. UBA6640 TaxID=1946370 RepID=UPI0025BB9F38|nr:hypothetical protein [Clostridium sp. UBA6640]
MGCYIKGVFILLVIGLIVEYPIPSIAIVVALIYFIFKPEKKSVIEEKEVKETYKIPEETFKLHIINFKYGNEVIKNRDFQVWLDGKELCFFGNVSPENIEMKQYIKIKIPTKNINFFTRIGDVYAKGKDREVVDNRETAMEVIDNKNEITYLRFDSDAYEVFLELIINKEKSLVSLRKTRNDQYKK